MDKRQEEGKKQMRKKTSIHWFNWGIIALFCFVCIGGVNKGAYAQTVEDVLQKKLKKANKVKKVKKKKKPRINERKADKEVMKGRLDSIRPEKIVITYEPTDQVGVELQSFYIRNENTQFVNSNAEDLKAGDRVAIKYEEIEWENEKGDVRKERIAKRVRFIKDRAAVEKENKPKKKKQQGTIRVKNVQEEQGPQ